MIAISYNYFWVILIQRNNQFIISSKRVNILSVYNHFNPEPTQYPAAFERKDYMILGGDTFLFKRLNNFYKISGYYGSSTN